MKKRFLSLLLASAMVMACLTACGGSKKEETKADATETTAVAEDDVAEAKILRVASEDPQVPLDMHLYTYSIIMKVTDNVYESLLLTNPQGELEPVLLTQMPTLSEDKLTYSFELKEGVKFHNGAILTSNDVKYSLERMVEKVAMGSILSTIAGYDEFAAGEAEEITGITIIDDTHFEITLSEVYTPLLAALSTPYTAIYPAEACEAAGDNWGMTELYGTGPFKMVSYQTGVGVELVKNEEYHGGEVKLDGIKYTFIDEPITGINAYKAGDIDVVYMESTLYPTFAEDAAIKEEMYSFSPVGGYYLGINSNVITEKEVRQALNYAMDRNALCQGPLFGTAVPNSNFLQAGLIGANPEAEQFEYNPEKAKELLAEAGYTEADSEGYVYEFELAVNTKYAAGINIATALQAQMKEAGIKVNVNQVDSAAWSDMKASGSLEVGLSSWYVDYNDPDSMLYPVSDGRVDANSIFWHNDEFKSLMEQGVQLEDVAERQEIYARADEILTHEEFAVAMLYNETMFYLKKPYVEGFEVTFTYRTMFKDADIVK